MGNSSSNENESDFVFTFPITIECIRQLGQEFKGGRTVAAEQVDMLLDAFTALLKPAHHGRCHLLDVDYPEGAKCTVVGDLHGQYWDLLNIFQLNGDPSATNYYVFNGDYVDRGPLGVEVVLTLMAWKVMLPGQVHMIRGNHELELINSVYGFQNEILNKYSDYNVFHRMNEAFTILPVGAVIKQAIFVVHGGVPRSEEATLQEIRETKDLPDPVEGTIVSDMLWSDPCDTNGIHPSPRNIGVLFGPDVAASFLERNKLQMVVRAHELCMEGYSIQQGGKVLTVFSAPNYCGRCSNLAAFVVFDTKLAMTIRQFAATSAPKDVVVAQPAVVNKFF